MIKTARSMEEGTPRPDTDRQMKPEEPKKITKRDLERELKQVKISQILIQRYEA